MKKLRLIRFDKTRFTYLGQKAVYMAIIAFVRRYNENISSIGTSGDGSFLEPSHNRALAFSRSVRNSGT